MGQTTRSLVNSTADVTVEMLIAFAGLVTCCLQFYFGKRIGSAYNDRISAGRALGQKNTVLAIWMAVTYLNPLSSVGPGSYVVWQNIINSYQLWKKRKNEMKNQVATIYFVIRNAWYGKLYSCVLLKMNLPYISLKDFLRNQ